MSVYDPHSREHRSSLVSMLHFAQLPSLSLLVERAESPLLRLLSAVRQFEKPSEGHLPDNGWSLPSSLSILRYWQRGIQSLLEQRPQFGWDWKSNLRQLNDLIKYIPSRAELIAHRIMGPQVSTAFLSPRPSMEIPEPVDAVLSEGLTFPTPLRSSGANVRMDGFSSGLVEHRLVVRAFDAPMTRADNIRRARVLDRLMSSGRGI